MKQTSYLLYILVFMIVGIINVTVVNAYRIRKGEAADKAFDKLNIEPLFPRKYKEAYGAVSESVAEKDYTRRAEAFGKDFRYDVVKYMNINMESSKLKALLKKVKTDQTVPFDQLPLELQIQAGNVADQYVKILHDSFTQKQR